MEAPVPEIDVAALKERIRDAVEQREASGKTSFIAASRELYKVLSPNGANNSSLTDLLIADISARWASQPRLKLQPEFEPRTDKRYHVNELLQFHEHQFVWNAYRALLGREPDEDGLRGFLDQLRSGRRNKIDILASIRFSQEGKRANVEIEGLKARSSFRRLYQIPIIGYLAELTVSLMRLPMILRSQRQLENYFSAQQELIVNHVDHELGEQRLQVVSVHQNASRFSESLTRLYNRQTEIAELQQKQFSAVLSNLQRSNANPGRNSNNVPDDLHAALAYHLRGEFEQVKNDLRHYLPLLQEAEVTSNVLDLGCGRGEWLQLLRESGVEARGVEANLVLTREALKKGLTVEKADALEHLRNLAQESEQVITGFHLIEHLEFSELIELFSEIKRVLKPGGFVILETPNPKNLVVGACNFHSDPTHRQPLFPETVQFLLNHLGFERVRIEYLHQVEDSPFKNGVSGSQELDTWLFGPRDFAAIGWKA